MIKQNKAKSVAKLVVKRTLVSSKRVAAKSKTIRKAGKAVREILLPDVASQNFYNYSLHAPTIADYQRQLRVEKEFKVRPLISVVMPTYNTPIAFLRECIESVLLQSYPNWELCIADDTSPNKDVVATIEEYMKHEKRIKLVTRKENGHISEATNSAIAIAKGDYISLLDHDDVLWPNALFEIVKAINEHPEADLIYTDEDKIDGESKIHSYPFFKPDWSPEFLESCNYITHFSTIRQTLLAEVGGLRKGYEGAQDWDLFLRITEKTDKVVHIPKVLYSWRIHEDSTAMDTDAKPYVYEAQRKLLVDHIQRIGKPAEVKKGIITQHSFIQYAVVDRPKVSIIIEMADAKSLKRALRSIEMHSTFKDYEILVVISQQGTKQSRPHLSANKVQYISTKPGWSPAKALNVAAKKATGDYLVFIEQNMTVHAKDWLDLLLGDAQRPGVGVVGGKIINWQKDRFMRAACAAGVYGLYAPLLEGMPLDDVHYMRGLYGQSRRNTSIVDGCFMVNATAFNKVGGFDEGVGDLFVGDLCLKLIGKDYRNIYNPFVAVIDHTNKTAGDADKARNREIIKSFQQKWGEYIENDPYFNPGFTRTNAQLDIK